MNDGDLLFQRREPCGELFGIEVGSLGIELGRAAVKTAMTDQNEPQGALRLRGGETFFELRGGFWSAEHFRLHLASRAGRFPGLDLGFELFAILLGARSTDDEQHIEITCVDERYAKQKHQALAQNRTRTIREAK